MLPTRSCGIPEIATRRKDASEAFRNRFLTIGPDMRRQESRKKSFSAGNAPGNSAEATRPSRRRGLPRRDRGAVVQVKFAGAKKKM